MAKASDNVFPRFLVSEGGSTATPASGRVTVYAKADGLLYSKDDAGVETLVSGGAGGGSVPTDAIWDAAGDLAVGTGANTAAKLAIGANNYVLTSNGTTAAWAAAAGGGGVTVPVIIQKKYTAADSATMTMDSTPANGSRLILAVTGSNAAATAVGSTNTTWTKMAEQANTATFQIWVGVCAASAGTLITVTTGASFTNMAVAEVSDALTPTAATVRSQAVAAGHAVGSFAGVTAGQFVAIGFGQDNPGNPVLCLPTYPYTPVNHPRVNLHLAYAPDGDLGWANFISGQSGALIMVAIT